VDLRTQWSSLWTGRTATGQRQRTPRGDRGGLNGQQGGAHRWAVQNGKPMGTSGSSFGSGGGSSFIHPRRPGGSPDMRTLAGLTLMEVMVAWPSPRAGAEVALSLQSRVKAREVVERDGEAPPAPGGDVEVGGVGAAFVIDR